MRGVLLDNITRQLSSWEDGEMAGPWSLRGSPTSSELRNCRFKQLKPQELMSFLKGEYSSNYWSHSKYIYTSWEPHGSPNRIQGRCVKLQQQVGAEK